MLLSQLGRERQQNAQMHMSVHHGDTQLLETAAREACNCPVPAPAATGIQISNQGHFINVTA